MQQNQTHKTQPLDLCGVHASLRLGYERAIGFSTRPSLGLFDKDLLLRVFCVYVDDVEQVSFVLDDLLYHPRAGMCVRAVQLRPNGIPTSNLPCVWAPTKNMRKGYHPTRHVSDICACVVTCYVCGIHETCACMGFGQVHMRCVGGGRIAWHHPPQHRGRVRQSLRLCMP